jgi:hypothetical protein
MPKLKMKSAVADKLKKQMDSVFNQISAVRRIISKYNIANADTLNPAILNPIFKPEDCPLAQDQDGELYHQDAAEILGYKGKENVYCPLCGETFSKDYD